MNSLNCFRSLRRLLTGISLGVVVGACQERPSVPTAEKNDAPMVADAGEIPSDPNDVQSIYFAGQQEFINGNFAKAAEHYRSVLLVEKSARAWHALGDVNMATMQFDAATDAFREAIRIEPSKRLSVMRLGQALQRGGRFGEAVEVYRQAQAMKPGDADAFRLEAEALVPLRRFDEAIERLMKAASLEKNPAQRARDYQAMAELELKREDMARATGFFEQAIAAEPSVELYAALADAALRDGRLEKSRDAFREAAVRDAKDPFYWEAVAELELRLGNRAAAREAFAKSIQVMPRALIHVALGRLELSEGRQEAAREQLSLALSTSEGAAQEVREAAHLSASLKDFALAEQLLLTLPDGEDTEDRDALWREIAAIRAALGKGDESVAEACAKAGEAFSARFPKVAAVVKACADSSPEALRLANDPEALAREIEKCHRAMDASRQGKVESAEALDACQALFAYQNALARNAKARPDAKSPDHVSCPAKAEDRPRLPECPPSEVPWQR